MGRSLLQMENIKQNRHKNVISFQRGKTKVCVPTQEKVAIEKEIVTEYAETINMMEGLAENPKIVPLFEIDVV